MARTGPLQGTISFQVRLEVLRRIKWDRLATLSNVSNKMYAQHIGPGGDQTRHEGVRNSILAGPDKDIAGLGT